MKDLCRHMLDPYKRNLGGLVHVQTHYNKSMAAWNQVHAVIFYFLEIKNIPYYQDLSVDGLFKEFVYIPYLYIINE